MCPTEVVGVASESLVPGDVLVVPPSGLTVPCDAALITGHAIVNEAMLTGNHVHVRILVQQVWTSVHTRSNGAAPGISEYHMTLM